MTSGSLLTVPSKENAKTVKSFDLGETKEKDNSRSISVIEETLSEKHSPKNQLEEGNEVRTEEEEDDSKSTPSDDLLKECFAL